jgi:hypothetical protein
VAIRRQSLERPPTEIGFVLQFSSSTFVPDVLRQGLEIQCRHQLE